MEMQDIKDRVTKVLDNRGVLARLKAELRANVFLAINDQNIPQGGAGLSSKADAHNREKLLNDPAGVLVVELVRDFLRWCNLQFTVQVFEPELQVQHAAWTQSTLQQQLGLPQASSNGPLLLQLLQQLLFHQAEHEDAVTAVGTSNSSNATEPLKAQQQQGLPLAAGSGQVAEAHAALDVVSAAAAVLAAPSAARSIQQHSLTSDDVDISEELVITSRQSQQEELDYVKALSIAQGHDSRPSDNQDNVCNNSMPHQTGTRAAVQQSDLVASYSSTYLEDSSTTVLSRLGLQVAVEQSPAKNSTATSITSSDGSATGQQPQQQQSVPSPAAAAAPSPATVESMPPSRAIKLAPLAPLAQVQDPTANATAAWKQTAFSDGLREQLRKEGILGSSYDPTLGPASTSSARLAVVDSDDESTAASAADPGTTSHTAPHLASGYKNSQLGTVSHEVLQGSAGSLDAERPAVHDRHGSIAGLNLSSDDDNSSDDFDPEAQRQLLHLTARQRLSQRVQEQAEHLPQQQQQAESQGIAAHSQQSIGDHDSDSNSGLEIPEDISLPLEGLDASNDFGDDDIDAYTSMLQAESVGPFAGPAEPGRPHPSVEVEPGQQQHSRKSMSLGETGLSMSDKSGNIDNLPSIDFVMDADDF